jgi:ATP-dependent DNA helicase RecQ
LLDLATYLPLTQNDLLQISGFGAYKAEKYGPPFLEKVQDYCTGFKLQSRIHLKQAKRERKSGSTVERSSDTKRLSLDMFRTGKSIAQIAKERALSVNTIEAHLSHYIRLEELPINDLVEKRKQQAIREAANIFGTMSLKVLKEHLPDAISYGDIKMVLAAIGDGKE